MKKIVGCFIIMLTLLFVFTLGLETPKASQEASKETVQAAPVTESESSHETKKVTGPVDSSEVIPKGPQWLGAPIMPNGKEVTKETGRLVTEYSVPYKEVLAWYQEALKRYPDARYRDWEEEMYIEDQGGSKWHAIKISKLGGAKTTVTMVKDNWTWIMATLLIRFTGVFVVLLILWIFLNISGIIVQRLIKEEKKPAAAKA
jgi:hypothetical protein